MLRNILCLFPAVHSIFWWRLSCVFFFTFFSEFERSVREVGTLAPGWSTTSQGDQSVDAVDENMPFMIPQSSICSSCRLNRMPLTTFGGVFVSVLFCWSIKLIICSLCWHWCGISKNFPSSKAYNFLSFFSEFLVLLRFTSGLTEVFHPSHASFVEIVITFATKTSL